MNAGASDATTTVADLRETMRTFVAARDWQQFHRPKNLAMSLAIEAGELMEHFQWLDHAGADAALADPATRQAVAEEVADVFAYLLAFANATGIDLAASFEAKMRRNEAKYPADLVRGHFRRPQLPPEKPNG